MTLALAHTLPPCPLLPLCPFFHPIFRPFTTPQPNTCHGRSTPKKSSHKYSSSTDKKTLADERLRSYTSSRHGAEPFTSYSAQGTSSSRRLAEVERSVQASMTQYQTGKHSGA
ncbi:hypothetical protein F5Y18DRAFT_111524 [Xylariaceae sp. FL1019]|nr:hypothetical protein F5Y18DRAFT_111524 [Xylariaceae sp. FL1019]